MVCLVSLFQPEPWFLPPLHGGGSFLIAPGVETWLKPQAESLSPFGTKSRTPLTEYWNDAPCQNCTRRGGFELLVTRSTYRFVEPRLKLETEYISAVRFFR
jgi:hypothetical protein